MLVAPLRYLFLAYFVSHIPITFCIDGQYFFGQWVTYPSCVYQLLQFHCSHFEDFLMRSPPNWFSSVLTIECVLQFPFFFVATWSIYTRKPWVRIPLIVYAGEAFP
jgi:hypothetical protein